MLTLRVSLQNRITKNEAAVWLIAFFLVLSVGAGAQHDPLLVANGALWSAKVSLLPACGARPTGAQAPGKGETFALRINGF